MDKGECFIQLDNDVVIDIPYSWNSFNDEVFIKELDRKATSLFEGLSDLPFYHLNVEDKSSKDIIDKYPQEKQTLFEKAKKLFFGLKPVVSPRPVVENEPNKIEYFENKLKYIKDRTIVDLIAFSEDDEKYFLELDNGYFITETKFGMNGTGRVGINVYENLSQIEDWKGKEIKRISIQMK